MNGWFSIHRKLFDDPIWTAEKFTKGQAWVDLIGLANYTPGSVWLRGIEIKLKRGQLAWSELNLGKRWKWSRKKVDNFLKWLEKEHQIEHQKTKVTTLITITNYDLYQIEGTTDKDKIKNSSFVYTTIKEDKSKTSKLEQQKNGDNNLNNSTLPERGQERRTSKEHQKNTENNINNINNINKTPPPYPPPEENMFSQEITDFLENHRREIKKLFKEKTGIDSYKVQTESLEALHELTTQHGVKLKDLDKMLKWGLQDEFWKKHLVNLGNLSKVKNNGRFGYYNLQEKYEGREKTIEEQTSRESYYQYFCEKKAEFEALTAERQEYMRKYHGTDGKMSWECDDMKDWFENYGKDKDE